MKIARFALEDWFRRYYFDTEITLCSSGVEEFTLGEIRRLMGISQEELDKIIFEDSQSHGSAGLRDAIARRWGGGDSERVLVAHGSSEAIFLIMHALLEPGDEVVVMVPCYQALLSIPQSIGCNVKEWSLESERGGFVPDVDRAKKLIGPKTKMVVVNLPNNPTGASFGLPELKRLTDSVSEAGAYLLWDAAFAEITFDGPPLPDPGDWYDRTISLGTLSKAYGLPGLRVGWCITSPEVLARCVELRDYITLNLSPLVELIAQRVVEQAGLLLDIRLRQARRNLQTLASWMEQHRNLVQWEPPRGGVSAFVRFPASIEVEGFCRRLAGKCGVLLLPGRCFGFPNYARIGFGGPTNLLTKGLDRLSAFLTTEAQGSRR
jgi:capreomycidine synthase